MHPHALVAALGVSQIIGYGSLYYAYPLLVPGLAAEFGATAPMLFGIFSAGLLAGGLVAPLAGRLMDRHGAPLLMAAGSGAAGAAHLVMAAAPALAVVAAAVVALQVIAVVVLYDAAFATLVRFRGAGARRSITRLTLVAGFASTIFWPLTGWLVVAGGWRGACLAFAVLHLTLALGLHLWLWHRDRAEDPGLAPATAAPPGPAAAMHVPLPEALARHAFRAVALSFALSAVLISAVGVHMVPVLAASGLGAAATLVAMVMGPAQVAIRLVDALFWGALHPLAVATISALALPLAVAGLVAGLPVWTAGLAFAALFGVGQGLSSIVRGSVPLALFGPSGYGARLGRLALIRTLASAGAPVLFALIQAAWGTAPALWVLLAVGLAAVLPLVDLTLRLRRAGLLAPPG